MNGNPSVCVMDETGGHICNFLQVLLKFSVWNNYRLTYIYKYFFMTLTLGKCWTLIYSISPTLDLSDVFSWLNSGCAFLVRIAQKCYVSFSVYPIRKHMIPVFSTIGVIIFDQRYSGGCHFVHSKVTVFWGFFLYLMSILWGNSLRLCKYPIYHHTITHYFYHTLIILTWKSY